MSTRPYDEVVLVFNPNSTGGAESLARELAGDLAERSPDLGVRLVPTEYAGHAREIAEKWARSGGALVVSVSGDGGYNEVVSGAMAAGDGTRTATPVAVHAAGNANDHRRATAERPLADAIAAGTISRLDLMRLRIDDRPDRWAHSYIGLGISPMVALELEKGGKGSLGEVVTTVREFARFRPFQIVLESGEGRRFDSVVLANIDSMAKVATLSDDGDPADGHFEVVTIPHRGKMRMLGVALRAAVRGLGAQPTATRYAFRTTSPMPLQLDGEVIDLVADQRVVVDLVPGALATVL